MSRCLKRLTITAAINKALQFPPLLHINTKPAHFAFSLLRRSLSSAIRFMDSLIFSIEDDDVDVLSCPFDQSFFPPPFTDPGESIYLVSFGWWREAVCGGGMGAVGGVSYQATVQLDSWGNEDGDEDFGWGFGDSDILVGMRREGEAGISGGEGVCGGEGDLALVPEWMFYTALKWHYNKMILGSSSPGGDRSDVLFPLHIRLLYTRETRQLLIKICQKDNALGDFYKAYDVFSIKSGMFQVWDFSGQTNQFFVNDSLSSMDSTPSHEVLLQLQIYGLHYAIINEKETKIEHMIEEQSTTNGPSSSSSFTMNGSVDRVDFFSKVPQSDAARSGFDGTFALGLTGLHNLGNTCFMNSAIQCLANTPELIDYFLGNFRKDLNCENPLGMNGKLAIAFGDLLRKLWAPGATLVSPTMFKSTISSFARQFSGYGQHDSQEFLSFLLDGLHEDLNRVKRKPYIEAKEEDGHPEEEVADEYWKNHLSRNDSVIVDLCQGQYRSSLVCPVCKKCSVTFDPFMYLSLPVPSSNLRKMTLMVFSTDGMNLPHSVTVTVPHKGTYKDLVEALGLACSLREDETLLIAEIYRSTIFRILDEYGDSLELIRDDDRLVAYRLPKHEDGYCLVEFIHQQQTQSYLESIPSHKKFGTPLVARISECSKGSDLQKEFLKIINPFLLPAEEFSKDNASHKSADEDERLVEVSVEEASSSKDDFENDSDARSDFEFYLRTVLPPRWSMVQMDEPVHLKKSNKTIKVLVSWSEKMIQDYDTSIPSVLPVVCKTFPSQLPQESISLYKCLDAFLKEEPLGPDDMWYCPNCKEHRQALKKLDLWRLPEILVIHLKRFSYTRLLKNKLETFVEFPVDDFDISNYVIQKNKACHRYQLYAISNHYGGMGGGHYTAFAKHRLSSWYEFDDTRVFPVNEEQIKTEAAYVLFYKRI